VIDVILNMIFIPKWGLEGAAISTATTVVIYALFRYIIIYYGFKLQPLDNKMFKIFILIIIGSVVNYFLLYTSSPIINIIYRTTVVLGMYLSGIYLLKIIPEFHSYIPFLRSKQ